MEFDSLVPPYDVEQRNVGLPFTPVVPQRRREIRLLSD